MGRIISPPLCMRKKTGRLAVFREEQSHHQKHHFAKMIDLRVRGGIHFLHRKREREKGKHTKTKSLAIILSTTFLSLMATFFLSISGKRASCVRRSFEVKLHVRGLWKFGRIDLSGVDDVRVVR